MGFQPIEGLGALAMCILSFGSLFFAIGFISWCFYQDRQWNKRKEVNKLEKEVK